MIDLFLVYTFIKKLATPFNKWEAFNLGIIDEDGNILKKRRELSSKEKKYWTHHDLLICRIKKMLNKLPGKDSKITSYAAALYYIKEQKTLNSFCEGFNEREEMNRFLECVLYVENNIHLIEDAPVNSAGSGNVAGIGVGPKEKAEPGFSPDQMRKYKKKKNILTRLKAK